MCRNIRPLFNFSPPARPDEVHDAALQYVRKISGMNRPSLANQKAFDDAVADIEAATERLVRSLRTASPPRDRDEEAARRRARSAARFGGASGGAAADPLAVTQLVEAP